MMWIVIIDPHVSEIFDISLFMLTIDYFTYLSNLVPRYQARLIQETIFLLFNLRV